VKIFACALKGELKRLAETVAEIGSSAILVAAIHEREQQLDYRQASRWRVLLCRFGNSAQLIETAWYGPHPTQRITPLFLLIGPRQNL
jgi:hypothetical protein